VRNTDESKLYGSPLYQTACCIRLEDFILKAEDEPWEDGTGKKSRQWKLADHMEALIGAMYIDSGKDITGISKLVLELWSRIDQTENPEFYQALNVYAPPKSSIKSLVIEATLEVSEDKSGKSNSRPLPQEAQNGNSDAIDPLFNKNAYDLKNKFKALILAGQRGHNQVVKDILNKLNISCEELLEIYDLFQLSIKRLIQNTVAYRLFDVRVDNRDNGKSLKSKQNLRKDFTGHLEGGHNLTSQERALLLAIYYAGRDNNNEKFEKLAKQRLETHV
jgi:hypothetical protein